MKNFEDRLIEEHSGLRSRVNTLKMFISDVENSTKMDMFDWNCLIVQKDIMVSYLSILEARMIKLEILPMEEE